MFSFQPKKSANIQKNTEISPTKLQQRISYNSQLVNNQHTRRIETKISILHICTQQFLHHHILTIWWSISFGSHKFSCYYIIAHVSTLNTHPILSSIFLIASSMAGTLFLKVDHCSEDKLIPKKSSTGRDMFSFRIQSNQVLNKSTKQSHIYMETNFNSSNDPLKLNQGPQLKYSNLFM